MSTFKEIILTPATFVVRKIIEFNIKSGLKDKDPEKHHLRRWLCLANDKKPDDYWKFKFMNGESLAIFAIKQSDDALAYYKKNKRRKGYLHSAQSYYKGLLSTLVATETNPPINFRWYHRLLGWLKKQGGLQWEFTSQDLNEKDVFEYLKQSEGVNNKLREIPVDVSNAPTQGVETPSIREKYSVAQLLSKPNLLFNRMKPNEKRNIATAIPYVQKRDRIPSHLKAWNVKPSMHQQIDMAQQQQQNLQQQEEMQLNASVDLHAAQQHQAWVDNSSLLESSKVHDHLNTMNYSTTADWLDSLSLILGAGKASDPDARYYARFTFRISEKAREMLEKSRGYIRGYIGTVSVDTLPLGFFVDKEKNTFILRYSEDYRQYQLHVLPDANVRLDASIANADIHGNEDTNVSRVTKEDLFNTFKEYGIHPNQEQQDFIHRLAKRKKTFRFGKDETTRCPMSAYIFRALQLMVTHTYQKPDPSTKQEQEKDNYIYEMLDFLRQIPDEGGNSAYGSTSLAYGDARLQTDLDYFTLCYLCHLTDGKCFYPKSQREALRRFVNLNENERHWYREIALSVYVHCNFAEDSKGMYYLFDCYDRLGINLPNHAPRGGFTHLKHILDCISLAGDGKNKDAQRIQAKLIDKVPDNFEYVKSYLRSGYSFVHKSMLLSRNHIYFNSERILDTINVSKADFEKMSYASAPNLINNEIPKAIYFRAMFLRYLAYYVKPSCIDLALDKWQKFTESAGSVFESSLTIRKDSCLNGQPLLPKLDEALKLHWDELKEFLFSLPSKMTATADVTSISDAAEHVPEGYADLQKRPNEEKYSMVSARELVDRLKLPDDDPMANEFLQVVNKVNGFLSKYADMSEKDLEKALNHIREISVEERIALLREAHYRLTLSRSSANPPEGELVRLEQLAAIWVGLRKNSLLEIDTGEGKTLIIQFVSLLKVLNGEKVDVLTHNEVLAETAADKISFIAQYLKLKVAKKTNTADAIINADIFYVDIATAILNKKIAQFSDEPMAGHRIANSAEVDEIDNIVVDVNADTTMQISENSEAAEQALIDFIMALNDIIRNQLSKKEELKEKNEQRLFVRSELQRRLNNNVYVKNCIENSYLDDWLGAAISAMQLVKESDYLVENDDLIIKENDKVIIIPRKVVRIVHKTTTGRVDKKSQWGEYIHQCVSVWEMPNYKNENLYVPSISQVMAEGDIGIYLRDHYQSSNGFTATTGEKPVKQYILSTLGEDAISVTMPRAERPLGEEANWPLIPNTDNNDEREVRKVYNRSYRFKPIYLENREEHFNALLEAIQNVQNDNLSCILFLDTIAQCNQFYECLKANNIDITKIQILDDTRGDKTSEDASRLRPAEASIIQSAHQPGKITLSTAAGGRGLDFSGVSVGINSKPGLKSVIDQQSGRIGRNGQFGLVYEIYCLEDLQLEFDEQHPDPISHFSKEKQENNLELIKTRQAERERKAEIQKQYFMYRKRQPNEQRKNLDKEWARFFTQFKPVNDEDASQQWQKFLTKVKK